MPIVIPKNLPANEILRSENTFVMNKERAEHQDVRPLEILLLNLMPTKIETETQLLRLLGNTPIQVKVTFIKTKSYESKNTSKNHLDTFYQTFDKIKDKKFDGLIITGAPVEFLKFEEVEYWDELKEIMEYSKHNVTSTLHICWGAQAGLYYHHRVPKYNVGKKIFGVFKHKTLLENTPLLRGSDDTFYAPHSRYTENRKEDIKKCENLQILAESKDAGIYMVATKDRRQIFVTGHSEYNKDTLKNEYVRDIEKGIDIDIPKNYFIEDHPENEVEVKWRSHAHLFFSNWINYCVYQQTPYEITNIK